MPRSRISDDDDDDDVDRPSSLSQTQHFTKSGTHGSKDLKMTQSKPKHHEVSSLKINLNQINDDDSLNDSEDDTNTKTGRSTSSATTSQLTPKPKERSFLRGNTDKPKIQPRRIGFDIDDDDHNVFGRTTMKSSPRYHPSSIKEDEERDQTFAQGFRNDKTRQSPTDLFSTDHRSDPRRNSRKSDHENKAHHDSDDETFPKKSTKPNNFQKSRHSPTDSEKSQSRRNSSRSKEYSDQSDHDDHEHSNKQPKRQDYIKKRQSNHDLAQTSPKETNSNALEHQPTSSRPSSASKKEVESARRSSYCEDKDTVIPPETNQKSQSRPTSGKTNTTRQQTQSIIDNVTSANAPPTLDPLTPNNEALAETLRPSSPPAPLPRPSAKLPPKPKSRHNTTTPGGAHNKKQEFKVPSRYKHITSSVDAGRKSVTGEDLKKSIDHALKKALKSQTLPRPQSSRGRNQSANSTRNGSQRRRSSSAYEHVKPRVNTNSSINFDELNATQMRADSSQSIKDGVYFEWLKAKEEQKKLEKKELKQQQEETAKLVDKTQIERKIQQNTQNLAKWRQEKGEEMKRKKQEEKELKREEAENKKRERQQKEKDMKDGFENWTEKKKEQLKQKADEEQNKKLEIEKRQEEKRSKFLKSEEKVAEWMNEKSKQIKKVHETKKTSRNDQLKTIRQSEESKFVNAQDAYEKWLKEKDKYEIEEKTNTKRRDSLSGAQVPFLPGGSQKNTGKVRHVIW